MEGGNVAKSATFVDMHPFVHFESSTWRAQLVSLFVSSVEGGNVAKSPTFVDMRPFVAFECSNLRVLSFSSLNFSFPFEIQRSMFEGKSS